MARSLGRIQRRVREICRDGAELIDDGLRTMSPGRWQLKICPAYQAYESTLIGQRQVDIARLEFARMRQEILVYEEDFVAAGLRPGSLANEPLIFTPPQDLDESVDARRARLLARFAREVQRPRHLEEVVA